MNNEETPRIPNTAYNQRSSGLIMIAVGLIFLFNQFSNFHINNWWALFILLPVATSWSKIFQIVKEAGTFTREAIELGLNSLFPIFIATIFLFDLDWGKVWPVFIIIGGVTALGNDWSNQLEDVSEDSEVA
jgi:hypothetical protein